VEVRGGGVWPLFISSVQLKRRWRWTGKEIRERGDIQINTRSGDYQIMTIFKRSEPLWNRFPCFPAHYNGILLGSRAGGGHYPISISPLFAHVD